VTAMHHRRQCYTVGQRKQAADEWHYINAMHCCRNCKQLIEVLLLKVITVGLNHSPQI